MYTTLNKIRSHRPCKKGWEKLLRHLDKTQADDEPLPLLTVLDSNGVEDAIWCLRAVEGHDREIRLFAVYCARQVSHLMPDPRSRKALDVVEAFVNGKASAEELQQAQRAACAAATYADDDAAAYTYEAIAAAAADVVAAYAAADVVAAYAAAYAAAATTYAADRPAAARQATQESQEAYLRELLCTQP